MYVFVVFEIVVQVAPLLSDCSHLKIFPLNPDTVNKPLVSPLQIDVELDNVPPTLCELISMNAGDEYSTGAVPLCITALKYVDVLKFVAV